MGKRNKPSKPMTAAERKAEDERKRLEMAERKVEIADLRARGLDVREGPGYTILSVRRLNCFNLLIKEAHIKAAVEWLDVTLRTATGENTPERKPDYIRGSSEGAPGQNITQDMIDAGEVLACVEMNMNPREVRMLFGLLKPDNDLLTRWRDVVERCTGETNAHAQGAVVRAACANLVWVMDNMPRLLRERRERKVAA
jgi:hypothetical protein